jgi:1,2-phenylacetyl-CoA epoxidase catalytic subunit
MSNENKNESGETSWITYRRLVLETIETMGEEINEVKQEIHKIELRVNTLETKLWAAIGVLGFLLTIVAPILTAMVFYYFKLPGKS